jgi:hypothetical protein
MSAPVKATLIGASLVAVLVTVLVSRSVTRPAPLTAGDRTDSTEPADGATPAVTADRKPVLAGETTSRISEDTEETQTARSVLEDYWGARWTEIEPAMKKAGVDLDAPFEWVPWEDAAASFEPLIPMTGAHRVNVAASMTQWPDDYGSEATEAWIKDRYNVPDRKSVSPADLLAIEVAASTYNDELIVLAADYVTTVDLTLRQRWQSGDYVKAPFGTYGVSNEKGFYSTSSASEGWSIVITLQKNDYPDLVGLREKAHSVRDQRDSIISRYLSDRG